MTQILEPPQALAPRASDQLELSARQLAGIDRFNHVRRMAEQAALAAAASREMRLDADRRLEVIRREHEALVARAAAHLRASGELRGTRVGPRAVVAHRQPWFVEKVTELLTSSAVEIVLATDNGAEAVGTVAAEQCDLVLVEDTLAMLSGEHTVREVRQFCPTAVIVAHVAYSDRIPPLLEAGASTVFTRQVPPAEIVQESLRLLSA